MTETKTKITNQIPILVCADIEAEHSYLVKAFGLEPGELVRGGDGAAVHGEIRAGDRTIWLHHESDEYRLGSPRATGSASGMIALLVDDVDSHFTMAEEQGADIVYEPVDQPYGYREYSARDPEGHLWSFMKPLD